MKRIDAIRILTKQYIDSDDKHVRDVIDFVNDQDFELRTQAETIESLKCCGNCEHARGISEVPNKLHHATYCLPCKNNSNWQPIN